MTGPFAPGQLEIMISPAFSDAGLFLSMRKEEI